jgi:hypothetical protein
LQKGITKDLINTVFTGKNNKYSMTNSDNIKKKGMIEALTASLGVVTTACKDVDIARQTHYRWMQEDEEYKRAVDDVADIALDFAESMLYKQIEGKDTTATIFYLKTKGKKRGYIERNELTGADGKDLNPGITIELIDSSDKVTNEEDTSSK